MSFTLKILFQGLIAAVPLNGGSSYQILSVDARNGQLTSDGDHIPSHYPVVRFPRKNVADFELFANQEDLDDRQMVHFLGKWTASSLNSMDGIWFLDNQDLELSYERNEGSTRQVLVWDEGSQNGANNLFAQKTPKQFFSLVPPIDLVSGASFAAARVDPDCLRPAPEKGLIAARFKIDEGLLQATSVAERDGQVMSLDFRPVGSPRRETIITRSISSGIELEVNIPGDSVTFLATKFGSEEPMPILKLAPAADQGSDPITVQVQNLPIEEFFGMRHVMGSDHDVDKHFELFYELSMERPPLHRRPIPHFESNGNGNGTAPHGTHSIRASDIFCPPATFRG